MRVPRIFCDRELKTGDRICLDAFSNKHITKVLRMVVGNSLTIFNGRKTAVGEFRATIIEITSSNLVISVDDFIEQNVESSTAIEIIQGIAKGEKMNFIIQKSTELGVSAIHPVFTEHCNVKLNHESSVKRSLHWQKIAISAAEQSGRCLVPKIFTTLSLQEKLTSPLEKRIGIVLDPRANIKLSEINFDTSREIVVLIGPEGGLSTREIAIANACGFSSARIGKRILRTETTSLAAISSLQTKFGDF